MSPIARGAGRALFVAAMICGVATFAWSHHAAAPVFDMNAEKTVLLEPVASSSALTQMTRRAAQLPGCSSSRLGQIACISCHVRLAVSDLTRDRWREPAYR